jgi:hypothetical protein
MRIAVLHDFCHHLHIRHESSDDGPSGPKHDVSGIIRTFGSVTVIHSFLFLFIKRTSY